MKTLTINIPDNLDLNNTEAAIMLAGKLFEQGRLSSGQAAELAGCSKREFMEKLGRYDMSIFNYSEQDLVNDIENASHYHL